MTSLLSISDFRTIAGILSVIIALITAVTAFYSYIQTIKSKEKELLEQNNIIRSKDDELIGAGEETAEGFESNENNSFFSNISFKIHDGLISDSKDLYDIFRGDSEMFYTTYQDFLLDYKYWLACVDEISYNDRIMSLDKIKYVFNFVSGVLQDEENKTLFKGVSQNDRSSLLAIQSLIKGAPNKTAISRELELLSLSLLQKQETLKWQNIMSISSLIFSILGILATILLSR